MCSDHGPSCNENQIVDNTWTPSFYEYDGMGSVRQVEHFSYSCELSEFNQAQLFLNGKAALRFSLRSVPIGEML